MTLTKKIDMTESQLIDLNSFKKSFENLNWEIDNSFDDYFEQGMSVPYQASAKIRRTNTEVLVRYSAGSNSSESYITVDYVSYDDYKTIILYFQDRSDKIVEFIQKSISELEKEGIRSILERIGRNGWKASINFYDEYLPLNEDNIKMVYEHVYEEE